MSFFKKIITHYILCKVPSTYEFGENLVPEKSLEQLRHFCEDERVKKAYEREIDDPLELGFLLNTFSSVVAVIDENEVIELAKFMNKSPLFKRVAPLFYNSEIIRIFLVMFNCCPVGEKRVFMFNLLESDGHMQGSLNNAPAHALHFLLNVVTKGFSLEDSVEILKKSPSLKILKNDQLFVSALLENHPEYKMVL